MDDVVFSNLIEQANLRSPLSRDSSYSRGRVFIVTRRAPDSRQVTCAALRGRSGPTWTRGCQRLGRTHPRTIVRIAKPIFVPPYPSSSRRIHNRPVSFFLPVFRPLVPIKGH